MSDARDRPNIVDVEASGFGSRSYPIEIGLALSAGARYCRLIRPASSWTHWDEAAEEAHHISREVLAARGRPRVEVALDLNRLLAGETVFSDGWSVDRPWISRLFAEAGVRCDFCVSPLERILTEAQMAVWHATQEAVIASLDLPRHRASTDAFIVQ